MLLLQFCGHQFFWAPKETQESLYISSAHLKRTSVHLKCKGLLVPCQTLVARPLIWQSGTVPQGHTGPISTVSITKRSSASNFENKTGFLVFYRGQTTKIGDCRLVNFVWGALLKPFWQKLEIFTLRSVYNAVTSTVVQAVKSLSNNLKQPASNKCDRFIILWTNIWIVSKNVRCAIRCGWAERRG